MDENVHAMAADDDANAMLEDFLLRLDRVISDVQAMTVGMPHFVVEARLREELRAELPAITFTAADTSAWAAGFSS